LGDRKSGGCRKNISIVVINDEALFVLLPAFDKPLPIFHHMLMLMTINIHPFLVLLIPPAQLVQPPLCCSYVNPTWPGSQLLLDFWCCNIINNVLGMYISFLRNFREMQLNIPSEVFILEDRRAIGSVMMQR